jgi:hypothetical protein
MKAHVGDLLWPEGDESRAGLIISVPGEDGQPPYVVRWPDGHLALVFPGPYARIVPRGTAQAESAP